MLQHGAGIYGVKGNFNGANILLFGFWLLAVGATL